MFLDNAKFAVKETISSSATTGATFKITPKFKDNPNESDVLIDTGGKIASVKLQNGIQIERMELTITAGAGFSTATIVKRGLKYDGTGTEVAELKCQWTDGTIGLITAFTEDLNDKTEDQTVADGKKLYFGANSFIETTNNGTDLKFKDANNSEVTLSNLTAGAGTDHKVMNSASDTTANYLGSKVSVSGGILKTTTNPAGNEVMALALDYADQTAVQTGTDNTKIVTSLGLTYKKASDAEVIAGTENTRFITSKQRKDAAIDTQDTAVSKSFGTDYQAATSGFVTAYYSVDTGNGTRISLIGYVGASNPASTIVQKTIATGSAANLATSICFPVAKGQWYRIDVTDNTGTGTNSSAFYFTPNK